MKLTTSSIKSSGTFVVPGWDIAIHYKIEDGEFFLSNGYGSNLHQLSKEAFIRQLNDNIKSYEEGLATLNDLRTLAKSTKLA